jgi:hypothetical protein
LQKGKNKRKTGRGKWAAREERERGERKMIFFKKTLFKFIFKLSNFNQTRNHAFES